MTVQILCALLIIAGLFLLFRIRPSDMAGRLSKPFAQYRERKQRVRRITGKPKGKMATTVDNAKEMLTAAGMGEQIDAYKWAAVILAVLGMLFGLSLNNFLSALVLAAGLGCAPLIVIRIRTGDYVRNLNEKLESAMGAVTNSYIASGDIIGAVENSLHLLPSPLDGVFRQFFNETQLIDSDIVKALRRMRERIDNRYWRDWCDVLGQCQRDKQLRYALPGIVSRLGEMRRIQMETDTTIRKQIGDYIITVMLVLGAIPMMGAMMPDWYIMLTTSVAGKITLAVVLAAVLATAVWVARLYRPVEGGEKQ
ncbi:MAG: type II secretion system F family protein [Christensenellales bacterium]